MRPSEQGAKVTRDSFEMLVTQALEAELVFLGRESSDEHRQAFELRRADHARRMLEASTHRGHDAFGRLEGRVAYPWRRSRVPLLFHIEEPRAVATSLATRQNGDAQLSETPRARDAKRAVEDPERF